MAAPTPHDQLPNFVSPYTFRTPFFYFHLVVDPETTTLTVEVIGPNLRFTFSHTRARTLLFPGDIRSRLEQKTVGFVCLRKGSYRHILAWAESGHGVGRTGDILDAAPGDPVLPNKIWTRRVIQMGTLLGFNMARPFDNGNRGPATEDIRGVFLGAHVEAKLAVHAVCVMLELFGITKDLDRITKEQLKRLRHVRWQDGTRPAFEVYFSRKNCHPCGNLVSHLEHITGIPISLHWKERLTKKVYYKPPPRSAARAEKRRIQTHNDQAVDLGDVMVIEDNNSDDSTASDSATRSSDNTEIVLDNQETAPVDLTESSSPLEPPPEPATPASSGVADFVDGMHARAAVLNLSRGTSTPTRRENRVINKPIPAKPVTEFPSYDDAEEHRPERGSRSTKRTRSSSPRRTLGSPRVRAVRERSPRRYHLWRRETKIYPSPTTSNDTTCQEGPEIEKSRGPRPTASNDTGRWGRRSPICVDISARRPSQGPSNDADRERSTSFRAEIPARRPCRSPSPFDF